MQNRLHCHFMLGAFVAVALGFALIAGGTARAQSNTTPDQVNPQDLQLKTVPKTSFAMPNVVGLTIAEAERAVLTAGKSAGVRSARASVVGSLASSTTAQGRIVRQVDAPGTAMIPNLDDVSGTYGQVTFEVYVSSGAVLAPYLIGRSQEDALAYAKRQGVGVDFGARVRDAKMRAGYVTKQSPEAGQPLPASGRVTVNLSAGYPLPDYRKRTIDVAEADAKKLGFRLQRTPKPDPEAAAGVIIDQTPVPKTLLPLDVPVTVTVSAGASPTPDFVGMSLKEVLDLAGSAKVRLIEGGKEENFDFAEGRVFRQEPAAKTALPPDRRVTVYFSQGWPVAPDAVDQSADDVAQAFRSYHPQAVIQLRDSLLTLKAAGLVVSQTPSPGVKLNRRQTLTLTVAAEKPVWFWPAGGALALGVLGGLAAMGRGKAPKHRSAQAGGLDDVRLRVVPDPGEQSVTLPHDKGRA